MVEIKSYFTVMDKSGKHFLYDDGTQLRTSKTPRYKLLRMRGVKKTDEQCIADLKRRCDDINNKWLEHGFRVVEYQIVKVVVTSVDTGCVQQQIS